MGYILGLMIGTIFGATLGATIMLIIWDKWHEYAYKEGYNAGMKDGFVNAFNQGRDYENAIGRYEDDGK